MRVDRVALQDVEHLDAADGRADRVVAERGDDHRHALLAGRLVAGDAEDPELGVGTRIDQRAAGGRVDAVIHADDEAGTGVLRSAGTPVEPLPVSEPTPLGVSSLNILTMTDWPGLGIVSPSASRCRAVRPGSSA